MYISLDFSNWSCNSEVIEIVLSDTTIDYMSGLMLCVPCVSAPSVLDVQRAIETIYPLVYEFRKEKTKEDDVAVNILSRKRKHSTSESDAESCD